MEKINYLIFGGLTTFVNYAVFFLVDALLRSEYSYLVANGIAWVAAVAFAFVTNKIIVFRSKTNSAGALLREAGAFVAARVVSLLIEYAWMLLAVEVLSIHKYAAKLIAAVVVIILNYFFSKLFIFRHKNEMGDALGVGSDADSDDAGSAVGGDAGGADCVGAALRWLKRNVYLLLSFFMPIMLLLIAFAVIEVYPFGKNSILIIDNHHQYTPFIMEFGNILRSGGSLLHSWIGGLGSNYLSRLAYYLSSPLNVLAVFVSDTHATEFVLGLVLLRAGAAGLAMFAYLRSKFRSQGFLTVAFAVMYALCGYFLAYYWNIMWFDCIALFPIVALGIERLVDRGTGLLYCLTLSYTIISNYFIAIMICIYSALYFFAYIASGADSHSRRCNTNLSERPGAAAPHFFAHIARRTGLFAVYSLIAGALSAIITLPAYFGLLHSSAAGAELPKTARLYSNILDIIANHLALIKPSIMVGLPNIYCGIAVLPFVAFYFLNRKIPVREKITNGLLVCFFIISFNLNTLDFLWHGTHFPNSLFFRFAFLYVFLILTMSYNALLKIDATGGRMLFAVFALLLGFILFMEVQPAEKTTKWTIYGSIAFAIIEAPALAFLIKKRREESHAFEESHASDERCAVELDVPKKPIRATPKIAELLLAALICAEIAVNAGYGIGEAGVFPKQNYFMRTGEIKPTVNKVNQLEQAGGPAFERMEFTTHTTYNTPIIYGYKGISYYSSTSYVAVNDLFGKLGLIHSNAWYVYRSAPPTLNSMFAIRYLLSQDGAYDNGIYDDVHDIYKEATAIGDAVLDGVSGDDAAWGGELGEDAALGGATDDEAAFDSAEPTVMVYENPFFLPVGFMVDEDILSWNMAQANPFLFQEDFYRRASGLAVPLFRKLDPRIERQENMTITSEGGADGVRRYQTADDGRAAKAVYTVTARRDGPVYFYVKSPRIETVQVRNITASERGASEPAGVARDHNIKYPYIIDAQYARAGDEVEIQLMFELAEADSFTLLAYDFDANAFGDAWDILRAQGLEVTGYTDTRLSGEISVTKPGLMYTSIPYDIGWRITVNGEPANVEYVGGGALIAVRLPAGRHTVEFRYMTPGLIPGALITLCAVLLLTGGQMLRVKRRDEDIAPYNT